MVDLRKIEVLIGACGECPYCQPKFVNLQIIEKCYKEEKSREIPDTDTIPDWCPLEKA